MSIRIHDRARKRILGEVYHFENQVQARGGTRLCVGVCRRRAAQIRRTGKQLHGRIMPSAYLWRMTLHAAPNRSRIIQNVGNISNFPERRQTHGRDLQSDRTGGDVADEFC